MLPSIAKKKVGRGGFMVLRPDSGDPIEAVLMALEAGEKVFGVDVNGKGYKVPKGWGVIQGDGINIHSLQKILAAVLEKGFSAEAVAFGMGGGLLQKVNRDTMSFATKLGHIVYADGTARDIFKVPLPDKLLCDTAPRLQELRQNVLTTGQSAQAAIISLCRHPRQMLANFPCPASLR